MVRIAVIGGGIGGVSQVYQLRDALRGRHELTLVSDSGRFEFTPSNPWVAVGWRGQEDVSIDLAERMEHFRRGFVLIDEFQRNPAYPNVYAVGVCVAIPPVGATTVPTGAPKTGYMIESMVAATTRNIELAIAGESPAARATWNAICLADFGDSGVREVLPAQGTHR
jgi:NADH dehydrogenase FAD-containing subunit